MNKEAEFPKWSEVKPVTEADVLSTEKRTVKSTLIDIAALAVHYGLPITCWCLPFALAYFLDFPWWQGAVIGYLASAALMTTFLLFFQNAMGRCSWKAFDLGMFWPITTFVMKDPIGLSIDLGMI